jgi:hypothetical protein
VDATIGSTLEVIVDIAPGTIRRCHDRHIELELWDLDASDMLSTSSRLA